MEIKELPKLKQQLAETKHLLSRLEESKDSISRERYEKLAQTYKTKIEDLDKQVNQLTDDANAQKFEIEQKLRDIGERQTEIDEDYGEIKLLYERQAVSEEEYKQKTKEYKSEKRTLQRERIKHEERLKELEFYLTQVGDVDYTKHKVQERTVEIKIGITSIFEKIGSIFTFRRLVIGVLFLVLLIGGYWVITKLLSPSYDTVSDIDGNVYQTVKIGDQWWMAENLRTTRYRNGDAIPTGLSNTVWQNITSGAYAIYPYGNVDGINSDAEMVNAYGKLYNWYAVADGRGLCPEGWHVPSDDEWKQLEMHLGMTQQEADVTGWRGTEDSGKLKSTRTEINAHPRWRSPNRGVIRKSGFLGLPAGFRSNIGYYTIIEVYGYWWSSTETDTVNAWYRNLYYDSSEVGRLINCKQNGFSIRCIKDE